MKILVLSDAHANIWALNKILETEKNYDKLVFAGDMVDYGIAPHEVIEALRNNSKATIVYGNHDRYAIEIRNTEDYSIMPDGSYKWLNHNLAIMTDEEINYLDSLPRQQYFYADGYAYLMQHQYILGKYDCIENRKQFMDFWKESTPEEMWDAPKKRMIFGHTHRQCIHILDEGMEWINPGSISYRRPDDPDKRAHYMTIEEGNIKMKQVEYNRKPLYDEAVKQYHKGKMKLTEIQDFMFFFGDAKTSRDEIIL